MHSRRSHGPTSRRAFTLMELMVSVAILLGVLALIGTIFSTASKAGGNATAVTHVYRQLRQAAEMIRRDLENMDPASDVLGVAGVAQQATDSRKATAPKLHRADVLMLLTDRGDARPYVSSMGGYDVSAYLAGRMQVVYGHADYAKLNASTGEIIGTVSPCIENFSGSSGIPSYEWHLARRTVFFPMATTAGYDVPLTRDEFLCGMGDLTYNTLTYYEDTSKLFPAGFFRYDASSSLSECYLSEYTSGCSYYLFGSKARMYSGNRWFIQSGTTWQREENGGPGTVPPDAISASSLPVYQGTGGSPGLDKLFYDHSADHRRTILDPNPAGESAARVAAQFLPNCSDFRVEYTYDDPRDVDFTHTYPNTNLNISGQSDPLAASGSGYSLRTRPIDWRVVPTGEQLIWSKITNSPTDRTNPFRWPRALRITLKCWDAGGRLDEPVTYTMVYTWPSGS